MRGICIDLGTSNTLVSSPGRIEVFREPSVVTVDTENNIILEAGESSKEAIGKTPENIITIKPISRGVITDYSAAEGMLKLVLKKAFNRTVFTGIGAVVSVPSNATQMEIRAVMEAVKNLGVSHVQVMPTTMAAAIGAGINVLTPTGNMVVDIGGGTTDVAVIALGHIATGVCVDKAGESIDSAIVAYIKRRYNVIIGENTAEKIKIQLGSAIPKKKNELGKYKGKDVLNGLPKEITVSSEEIRGVVTEVLDVISDSVVMALEKTPPELLSNVMDSGITLTGGCSEIYGIDQYFIKKTGFKTTIAGNGANCTLRGLEKAMADKKLKSLWIKK